MLKRFLKYIFPYFVFSGICLAQTLPPEPTPDKVAIYRNPTTDVVSVRLIFSNPSNTYSGTISLTNNVSILSLQAQNAAQTNLNNSQNTQLLNLTNSTAVVTTNIAANASTGATHSAQIAAQSSQLLALTNTIAIVTTNVSANAFTSSAHSAQIASQNTQLLDLTNTIAAVTTNVSANASTGSTQTTQIAAQSSQLLALTNSIATVTTNVSANASTGATHSTQISALDLALIKLKTRNDTWHFFPTNTFNISWSMPYIYDRVFRRVWALTDISTCVVHIVSAGSNVVWKGNGAGALVTNTTVIANITNSQWYTFVPTNIQAGTRIGVQIGDFGTGCSNVVVGIEHRLDI